MSDTINKINDRIVDNIREMCDKIDGQIFGLSHTIGIRNEEVSIPAVILPNGECISIYDEADQHDIVCYHHMNSKSYQESANSFGNLRTYDEICDMSLVVFGKRRVSPYAIENALCAAISSDNGNVLQGTDFNSTQVFAQEFNGLANFLNPDFFLFKINYKITSTKSRCKK